MVRMRIQLTEAPARAPRREAAAPGASIAALMRDAVERRFAEKHGLSTEQRWDRLIGALGSVRGEATDVAENHDRYLAEAALDRQR